MNWSKRCSRISKADVSELSSLALVVNSAGAIISSSFRQHFLQNTYAQLLQIACGMPVSLEDCRGRV